LLGELLTDYDPTILRRALSKRFVEKLSPQQIGLIVEVARWGSRYAFPPPRSAVAAMRLQVARIRADLLHIFGCLHQFETFRLLCPVLHVARKQLISDDLFYVSVLWQ
jgi:hypothetical protein